MICCIKKNNLPEHWHKVKKQNKEDKNKTVVKLSATLEKSWTLEQPWQCIDGNSEEISICTVKTSKQFGPQLNSAVLIKKDLTLNVFIISVKLPQIDGKELPLKVNRVSGIKQICEAVSRINSLDTEERCSFCFLC